TVVTDIGRALKSASAYPARKRVEPADSAARQPHLPPKRWDRPADEPSRLLAPIRTQEGIARIAGYAGFRCSRSWAGSGRPPSTPASPRSNPGDGPRNDLVTPFPSRERVIGLGHVAALDPLRR